jgi:hypothetical protein
MRAKTHANGRNPSNGQKSSLEGKGGAMPGESTSVSKSGKNRTKRRRKADPSQKRTEGAQGNRPARIKSKAQRRRVLTEAQKQTA